MKNILLILALLCLAGNATADETHLDHGALIAHHPNDLVYSAGEDWCVRYNDTYAIFDVADQNPRTDVMSDNVNKDVWYVLCAFLEDKVWCGTQFGLGDYDAYAWVMTRSGNCLANSLEIPTAGWPGPLTGISIAATDTPYNGSIVPIYWFEGYTYSGDATVVPITEDPSQDFVGFGNCEAPAEVFEAECLGALGVFTDGIRCGPGPWVNACCDELGNCEMMLPEICIEAGGISYPGEHCGYSFECPILIRACCFVDGTCSEMLPEICEQSGGYVFDDYTTCDPNPCVFPMGACCYEDGSCQETIEVECDGDYWTMFSTCEPNLCEQPSATDDSSWGLIKTMYR